MVTNDLNKLQKLKMTIRFDNSHVLHCNISIPKW